MTSSTCTLTISSGQALNWGSVAWSNLEGPPADIDSDGCQWIGTLSNAGLLSLGATESAAFTTVTGGGTETLRDGSALHLRGSHGSGTVDFATHGAILKVDQPGSCTGMHITRLDTHGGDRIVVPDSGKVVVQPNNNTPFLTAGGSSLQTVIGNFTTILTLQSDNNLCLGRAGGNNPLWSSQTSGTSGTAHAFMQTDGNMVVYWTGGSWGISADVGYGACVAGSVLVIEPGDLVVRAPNGSEVWRASTNGAGWVGQWHW